MSCAKHRGFLTAGKWCDERLLSFVVANALAHLGLRRHFLLVLERHPITERVAYHMVGQSSDQRGPLAIQRPSLVALGCTAPYRSPTGVWVQT